MILCRRYTNLNTYFHQIPNLENERIQYNLNFANQIIFHPKPHVNWFSRQTILLLHRSRLYPYHCQHVKADVNHQQDELAT